MMKFCHKCQTEKSPDSFGKDKWRPDGLTTACKKCRNSASVSYRKKNPDIVKKINDAKREYRKEYYRTPEWQEKLRRSHLKSKFGLTQEDYERMLRDQNGVCLICKQYRTQSNKNYLHIDHCHDSGKIRGLLCYYCNAGLGWFQDNTEYLNGAIQYLEEKRK